MPRHVRLAVLFSFLLHGALILAARYRLSYDAYNHMFFGDHYRMDWWSLWDARWYTGFAVNSYPPLVHQLIGALSHIIGLDAAFASDSLDRGDTFPIGGLFVRAHLRRQIQCGLCGAWRGISAVCLSHCAYLRSVANTGCRCYRSFRHIGAESISPRRKQAQRCPSDFSSVNSHGISSRHVIVSSLACYCSFNTSAHGQERGLANTCNTTSYCWHFFGGCDVPRDLAVLGMGTYAIDSNDNRPCLPSQLFRKRYGGSALFSAHVWTPRGRDSCRASVGV